jgi:hypothetical protein
MLNKLRKSLENLIPLLKEKRQAEQLALQAEMIVRELSGLPSVNSDDRDIISVLNSIGLLLKRFQERPELLNPKEIPITQPHEVIKTEEVKPPPESPPVSQIVRETPDEKPSATAEELIRLRDWVLLANSGEGKDEEKASPKVLDAIYKQLGKILQKEGITALEETGSFNYERHQVVSTQPTDDPQKEDLICDTVRPGYFSHDSLIRPQEVIVYQLTKDILLRK